MSEYTKGPWNVVAEIFVDDSDGRTVCVPIGYTPEQRIARAHLIAAAPELLEALRECEWLDGGLCPQCAATQGQHHQTKCVLGNAIAKAEASHA